MNESLTDERMSLKTAWIRYFTGLKPFVRCLKYAWITNERSASSITLRRRRYSHYRIFQWTTWDYSTKTRQTGGPLALMIESRESTYRLTQTSWDKWEQTKCVISRFFIGYPFHHSYSWRSGWKHLNSRQTARIRDYSCRMYKRLR